MTRANLPLTLFLALGAVLTLWLPTLAEPALAAKPVTIAALA